jgi:enamine deaminase RidA (YjgF/YER057c/UK114 family)
LHIEPAPRPKRPSPPEHPMRKSLLTAAVLGLVMAAGPAAQAENKHIGEAKSPISSAVFVPAGSDMLYVSGLTPTPLNADAPEGTPRVFGDTETQVRSILGKIEKTLTDNGFSLGDVVMMRIVLVGDPAKGGVMDRAGMMKAYLEKFGTPEQPMKPARITTQIAGLGAPGMFAEIEVQAARKK